MRLSLPQIELAAQTVSPVFAHSPQYECESLSHALGCSVILKVETLNPIRCFKGRGAELAIKKASDAGHKAVVCASAGNLGQAVAYSARAHGIAATVVASKAAISDKLIKISDMGAGLNLVDGDIELARDVAREVASANSMYLIEDSENLATCEGAATIGLELTETSEFADPGFDAVLLALGGWRQGLGTFSNSECLKRK